IIKSRKKLANMRMAKTSSSNMARLAFVLHQKSQQGSQALQQQKKEACRQQSFDRPPERETARIGRNLVDRVRLIDVFQGQPDDDDAQRHLKQAGKNVYQTLATFGK